MSTSLFAMNGDEQGKKKLIRLSSPPMKTKSAAQQRLERKLNARRGAAFRTLLDIHKEQAEYHTYMRDLIKSKIEDPDEELLPILGFHPIWVHETSGEESPDDVVSLESVAQELLAAHANSIKLISCPMESREKAFASDKSTLIKQVAAIYFGAITNISDTEERLKEEASNIRTRMSQDSTPNDYDIRNHYGIAFDLDKILFYKRLQKSVLENFSSDLVKIYKELQAMASRELNEGQLNPELLRAFFKIYKSLDAEASPELNERQLNPEVLRLSAANLAFCRSLQTGEYKFPSPSSLDEGITFDETKSPENTTVKQKKKKKSRKKRNRGGRTQQNVALLQEVNPVDDVTVPESVKDKPTSAMVATSETQSTQSQQPKKVQSQEKDTTKESPSVPEGEKEAPAGSQTPVPETSADTETAKVLVGLDKQYAQDRQSKKKRPKKKGKANRLAPIAKGEKEVQATPLINKNNGEFLQEVLKTPANLNLKWNCIRTLFKSPSGFKGNVLGNGKGSSNTFEVFMRFEDQKLVAFLSEKEFHNLREDKEPILYKDRKYLKDNKRLESYKISENESISKSFFTLHNPHPSPFAYRDLVERLQMQLALLGITKETLTVFGH